MNTWGEIAQATLNKLFLEEDEAKSQGYFSKFQYLANEGLNIIANGVKPKIVGYNIRVFDKVVYGSNFNYDVERNTISYLPAKLENGELEYITPDKNTIYYEDDEHKYTITNGVFLLDKAAYYIEDVIVMPEDFLSFADMVNYYEGQSDPEIVYLSDTTIQLHNTGRYVIYYNALWDEITTEYTNNKGKDMKINIPSSVLNTLPSYIASQVLSQDDIQRSTVLKNEFELMLARLDTNVMYESNHFKSSGGWY